MYSVHGIILVSSYSLIYHLMRVSELDIPLFPFRFNPLYAFLYSVVGIIVLSSYSLYLFPPHIFLTPPSLRSHSIHEERFFHSTVSIILLSSYSLIHYLVCMCLYTLSLVLSYFPPIPSFITHAYVFTSSSQSLH